MIRDDEIVEVEVEAIRVMTCESGTLVLVVSMIAEFCITRCIYYHLLTTLVMAACLRALVHVPESSWQQGNTLKVHCIERLCVEEVIAAR